MDIENTCRLIIMRHAKSDWDAGPEGDFTRPLSKRGTKDADKMGGWLVEQGLIPDIIIASPAVRAKQTALIVSEHLKKNENSIIWDEDIYEAALSDLVRVVDRYSAGHKNVLLIGHNPGLDKLVCYLSESEPELTPSGKLLTTCAVAILEFKGGQFNITDHAAKLSALVRPKQLN